MANRVRKLVRGALALWVSFAMAIVFVGVGTLFTTGVVEIPLMPAWVAVFVGWTLIVIGALSLLLWALSLSEGILKRLGF